MSSPDPQAHELSPPRRALITGLGGQDGSYLAELLLADEFQLFALTRGGSERPLGWAEHLRGRVQLIPGDLLDGESLRAAVRISDPHEIYHLAAPSFIPRSWESPSETFQAIVGATAVLLECVRDTVPQARLFFAGSGAMFGAVQQTPQDELTACVPTNPYAISKLAAHQMVGAFRAHHGLYVCSGILFNHESERRPEEFVTRRITRAAAAIALGLQQELTIGDLSAVRDWSFAGDIMRGARMMLRRDQPEDFVLASGHGHTVAELARVAFAHVGLDAERYLRVDPSLVRGRERTASVGNPSRAHMVLGWQPELNFTQLIERMVDADLAALQRSPAANS